MPLPHDTEHLRFRRMTPADLDEMAKLLGDPAVMQFYPSPKTREQAAAWITWNQHNYTSYGLGLWIIETHDGDFVGDCGLTWQRVNGELKLEVEYHVSPSGRVEDSGPRPPPPVATSPGSTRTCQSSSRSSTPTTGRRRAWRRRSACNAWTTTSRQTGRCGTC